MKKAKGPLLLLNLDKAGPPSQGEPPVPDRQEDQQATAPRPQTPAFETLQRRPWMLMDLFRALLILLSFVVAAGFVLILLRQPAVDKMAQDLQLSLWSFQAGDNSFPVPGRRDQRQRICCSWSCEKHYSRAY